MKKLNYIFYLLLAISFFLIVREYRIKETTKHAKDLEIIVNLSKLSAILNYQKHILIEVREAEEENRKITFRNVNKNSGFYELDSICSFY